jgi:uncharacterized integral membrane protein
MSDTTQNRDLPNTTANTERQKNAHTAQQPRRARVRLPFENRKQDAGEWAYDHRLGLSVMVILYLVLGIVFFSVFALTHIVSVCSISVAILLPVGAFLLGQPMPDCLLALFTGLLVVFQHRSNIGRLLRGEESKFKPKSKE